MLSQIVVYEVVGNFQFGTQAEVDAIPTMQGVEVEPELRLTHENKIAIHFIVVPKVEIAAESAKSLGESAAPNTCELEAAEGVLVVLTSEIILIEGLHAEGLREVG